MAKRGRESCTESGSSPLGPTHRTPDHDPHTRKAAWATSPDEADFSLSADVSVAPRVCLPNAAGSHTVWSATHAVWSLVGTSAGVSVAEYSAPPTPAVLPLSSVQLSPNRV